MSINCLFVITLYVVILNLANNSITLTLINECTCLHMVSSNK